jgi:uncharacterized membrane protein YdbT with pleckstrin-like domain
MGLPRRLLTSDEEIILQLRPHWVVLTTPIFFILLGVAVGVTAVVRFPHAPIILGDILLALIGVAVLWLGVRLVRRQTTSVVITTTRLIRRSGILGRTGLEVRLDRVNELTYHQTLIGRLLREGWLEVETGGEAGVVIFDYLPHPDAVQSVVTEQVSAVRRQLGGLPRNPLVPSATGRTVADQLVELDGLRQRGILSDEEFAAKKRDLLDRM